MRRLQVSRAPRTALAMAAIALVVLPSQVAAAILWTLTASPLTATSGVPTTFTLVGTNGDPLSEIGCIRVGVPSATVLGASVVSASNGSTWLSSINGNTVRVQSQDGGGRLALLQSVTFTIQATPWALGPHAWSSNAYTQQDCTGIGSVLGVPPVVTVIAAAPTAVPTPAPTPNPATPTPTPTPQPILPLPSVPIPSLPVPSLPLPSSTASPILSVPLPSVPAPSTSASPGTNPVPGPGAGSGSDSGGGSTGGSAAPVAIGPTGLGVRTSPLGSEGLSVGGLGSADSFGLWLVPATVIAGPGLLAIIWLVIQVLAGLAWLPAARRVRGRQVDRRIGRVS